MNIKYKLLVFILPLLLLFYLSLPSPAFPVPPPTSLQSNEPADLETTLRQAYFTDYSRAEILKYYKRQFSSTPLGNLKLPTYRLNYPTEEAQTLIRDQTRSTFLEELVHPMRESIYVNGFEPKEPQNAIFEGGKYWRQKIIIRYVPSSVFIRLGVGLLIIFVTSILGKNIKNILSNIKR